MTSNLKILRVRDFIKATPQGTLDLPMVKELIQEVSHISDAFITYDLFIE
jgi:hypothetical protein